MRIAFLLLVVVLRAAAAEAQGTIKGSVTDKGGAVIPGVEVVAFNSGVEEKVVTDSAGRYEFPSLPAGTYSITATLMGFVTGKREGVTVVSGQTTGPLDFALCVARLIEIDWVVPRGLDEMWKWADVVAYVRIVGTSPVRSGCPNADFEHTVAVIETLKDNRARPIGHTLTFVQENWVNERTPYPIGQEMIVFLAATQEGFVRLSGPYCTFLVRGNEVVSPYSTVKTDGMTPRAFLAKLRALAKEPNARR
jgi:hypothetical protein